MKKIISVITSLFLFLGLCGCSKNTSVTLKEDVIFRLEDVMKIQNKESNSIYYYYMAIIENNSDSSYDTSLLSYSLTDDKDENINAIDRYMSTPSSTIASNESTYVYGYVGFPNNNQKDIGFYFPKTEDFLSFNAADVREADNTQIQEQGKEKFTLFEDGAMALEVDASKTKADFSNGTTKLSNLQITYINKTDHNIVIPYLEPHGILNGLDLTQYSDKGDFSGMSLEDYKKIDFSNDGLAPKTEDHEGTATGYIVYFLEPQKEMICNIEFTFENVGIDYSDKDTNVFTINLISNSFGSTTTFDISY